MSHAAKSPALRVQNVPFAGSLDVPETVRMFSIVRDGWFAGREFRAGEVALVHGTPEEGDAVVLVAAGPGRPRLGRVQGLQLVGDQGEPCLMSRWEVAGRVIGVARPMGTVWVIERFDGVFGDVLDARPAQAASASTGGWRACAAEGRRVSVGQLDLFAAWAAGRLEHQ